MITNGALSPLGVNHFCVESPAHSTARSTLLELRASDSLVRRTDTVALPISGTLVTVEAWKLTISAVDLAARIDDIKTCLIACKR